MFVRQQSYSGTMCASNGNDHVNRKPCCSLYQERSKIPSPSRITRELIRQIGCCVFFRMLQRSLVAAGYHPWHSDRCYRLMLDHCCFRCMLIHSHQNWNHQYWSQVIFADESRISLYNYRGGAWVCQWLGEGLLDCCIHETDGIRKQEDQDDRGDYPWSHQQLSDRNSAKGSNFVGRVLTCGGGGDDQESVGVIYLNVLIDIQLILNCLWTVKTIAWCPVHLISCTLFLDDETN